MSWLKGCFILLSFSLAVYLPPAKAKPTPQYNACQRILIKANDQVRSWFGDARDYMDHHISQIKPWKFDPEDEQAIEAIFQDPHLSDEAKFEQAFYAIVEARLKQLNPVSRFFARRGARDALRQRSIYSRTLGRVLLFFMGPHYNPILNRTSTHAHRQWGATPLDALISLHEAEHLVHRNTNPVFWAITLKVRVTELFMTLIKTPASIPLVRRSEVHAMGAQWEFVRLIPPDVRERLLQEAEEQPIFQISNKENLLLHALLKTGVFKQFTDILRKGLAINEDADQPSTSYTNTIRHIAIHEALALSPTNPRRLDLTTVPLNSHREALEDTALRAFFGLAKKNWFKTFSQLSHGRISHEDLAFVRGVFKKGVNYPPVKHILTDYLDENDEADILGSTELNQSLIARAHTLFTHRRYPRHLLSELNTIYLNSLRHADAPKEEFVRRLSVSHNYTLDRLSQQHYQNNFRTLLLFSSLLGLALALEGPNHTGFIFAHDLRWITELLWYLL